MFLKFGEGGLYNLVGSWQFSEDLWRSVRNRQFEADSLIKRKTNEKIKPLRDR